MGANYEQQWVESVDRRLAANTSAISEVGRKIDNLATDVSRHREEFQRDGKEMARAMGVPVLTPEQGEALNIVIAKELAKEIVAQKRAATRIIVKYWWAFLLGSIAGADQLVQLVHTLLVHPF